MDTQSTPFNEETPFPEVSEDPFAGLEPADPFAGLRASSTSPRHSTGHGHDERPRRRRKQWRPSRGLIIASSLGLVALILVALAVVFWPSIEDRFAADAATAPALPVADAPTATTTPSAVDAASLAAALSAAGFDDVAVAASDGRVTLTGTVADDAALAEVTSLVMAQRGVTSLDNQLFAANALTAEQLTLAAEDALAAAGFARVTVEVDNGVATLGGFVPITALEDGFFGYVQRAEATVTRIDGIDSIVSQIGIKGNAAQLRDQLTSLTDANPIVFESGSAALSAESAAVLDEAATAIISQPGLQVFIAGHTDTAGSSASNEELARGRAGAVYQYLAQRGVPANRMFVVAYGELFPDAEDDAASRRIEFEVGG